MFSTLFYFVLTLLLLVVFHELGHFLVARCLGVKVLRFSFGFGKVLASCHDKKGTEYAWSLIPLGGYVKMLDETEEAVASDERHLAFNNKPLWVRVLIVIAGPLFNLLFAFGALWLVLVMGSYSLAPFIGEVKVNSLAARAGLAAQDEIVALNNTPIHSWQDFQYALLPAIGTDDPLLLKVKSSAQQIKTIKLSLPPNWLTENNKKDFLGSLGITPFLPKIPPIIGEVMANSPAATSDLTPGDQVISFNGKVSDDWLDFVEYVRQHPGKPLELTIKRHDAYLKRLLTIGSQKNATNTQEGYLGLRSQAVNWPKQWLRFQRQTPGLAAYTAFNQTMHLTAVTFSLMGRLVMGKIPVTTLSGPVGIAQGAGESGRNGLIAYLYFLALISVSLGVLNLLPIPMLDGGYLLYYLIEVIYRRPISEKIKGVGIYCGLFLLLIVTVIALKNDISRLLIGG